MPNKAGTFFNPQTGERKAFNFGTQPKDWQLETPTNKYVAPKPAEQKTYTDWINEAYETPEYTDLQKKIDTASSQLSDLSAKAPTYYDETLSNLKTQDPLLNQLQQQRGKLVADLYASPFEAQAKYTDIFDPNKREALIARATGNIMGQLSTTSSMIENRGGTLEQQANTALKLFQGQLDASKSNLESLVSQEGDFKDLLKSIADKNYTEAQAIIKRQQDMEDYFTKYTGKLEIDRQLGIGDFKPKTSPTTKPTEAEKQMGQYASLRGQYKDDYLKWIADKSGQYGMSLDPNSADVRSSYEAEQTQLTYSQAEDEDFRASLQDAISAIDSGMDEDDAKEELRRIFPDRAKEIDDAFSY